MQPKYKRILLKLSGEAMAGEKGFGLDFDTVLKVCAAVQVCVDAVVQVAIVVGGGNIWRGRSSGSMDRTRAELERKLQAGEYPREAVEAALAYVESFGYLDDRERQRIYGYLMRKGFSSSDILSVLKEKEDFC